MRANFFQGAHLRSLCWSASLALVLGLTLNIGVQAQDWETIQPKLTSKDAAGLKRKVDSAVRNQIGFGADQASVDDYFKKYYFPMMTSTSPGTLAKLSKFRGDYFKYIYQAANPNSQQYLVQLALNVSRVLARGNYHPAVRYNAVLMLGDLDQQQATGTTPPVPLVDGTKELLELVEQQEFNKVPVPESVKLGALVSLERHSRYGIDPQLQQRVTEAMLKVIASREAGEGVEQEVHDWVRCLAAQVLANQAAQAGPAREVQDALTSLIADDKLSLDDRCQVIAALRKVKYPSGADINGDTAVQAVASLTQGVVAEAAKLARKYQKEVMGDTMPMGRGGGGFGGRGFEGGYGGEYGGGYGGGGLEDQGPHFERRQLMARLMSIGSGSKALSAGLADEPKSQLNDVLELLPPVMRTMDDKNAVELDITKEVIDLESQLESLIAGWPAQLKPTDKAEDAAATGF